ncbi:Methionine-R-sulfoxide reductase B3 [Takifugu flavidus]|uniref:L-methionine (R)-S-oxide reductase n=1 Tax=Takifugu flavidus TaxID=433684 RepID=A0A5C6NHN2_9TELE|nr:Methionine-R-sulfoxide reductase B3 [Takifugu flavidus]
MSDVLIATLYGGSGTKKTQVKNFSQEELKKRLTPLQYRVTQEKGTESAFSGEFTHHRDEGTYTCVVCGDPLFSSNAKFDSGSDVLPVCKTPTLTLTNPHSNPKS